MEEVSAIFSLDCTTLDVTKFPSARGLRALFDFVPERAHKQASSGHLSQGPRGAITEIPWLEQLAALAQLTRVELNCGEFSPGKVLTQLPAGCELAVHSVGKQDLTSSKSLPHCASLPHLVTLGVRIHVQTGTPHVGFSCLASCPNLRDLWLSVAVYHRNAELEDHPGWVDLSTLDDVPPRCSVVFRYADIDIGSYKPPAGWSVAPHYYCEELICFRHDSQDCTAEPNSCWPEYMNVWRQQQAMMEYQSMLSANLLSCNIFKASRPVPQGTTI